jgi:hypothetical protein
MSLMSLVSFSLHLVINHGTRTQYEASAWCVGWKRRSKRLVRWLETQKQALGALAGNAEASAWCVGWKHRSKRLVRWLETQKQALGALAGNAEASAWCVGWKRRSKRRRQYERHTVK